MAVFGLFQDSLYLWSVNTLEHIVQYKQFIVHNYEYELWLNTQQSLVQVRHVTTSTIRYIDKAYLVQIMYQLCILNAKYVYT